MFFLNVIIFFILGTIIGSFLNVLVLRFGTGLSFARGRSKCFSCGKTLSWHELVPVVSYLLIGGKCTACESKISFQYPLVEFFTGLVFSLIFWKVGLSIMIIPYIVIFSLLIAIFIYDLGHKIIPDSFVWIFNVLAFLILVNNIGFSGFSNPNNFLDILSGPILFSFFAFFWLISSGKWMGFGDAKLALGVGWFLGFSGGVFAILLAFWTGALWGLIAILFSNLNICKKKLTIKSEVPFAPFILLGLFIVFMTGWNLTSLFYLLG
jgi:leader peptidase (prepilin peptidase)/N-methyltransferase